MAILGLRRLRRFMFAGKNAAAYFPLDLPAVVVAVFWPLKIKCSLLS